MLPLALALPCLISHSFALNSCITFLKGRVALSSFANLSFFVLVAVVPCSSSLATQRWRNVQSRADPAGYLTFPMKQRCRKLEMAFSRVSIPKMNTRCSSMRSKTILLKHQKGTVSYLHIKKYQFCVSGMSYLLTGEEKILVKFKKNFRTLNEQ